MGNELTTFGHATLVVTVDGTPRLATDPWLLGSTYWRSWWLERYPTPEEIELVRQSELTYITHSHPDHFHWPSLRMLGPKTTLHPTFPSYGIPHFLRSHGYPAHALKPWQRYRLADGLTMSSVPIPIDDSILLIESATTLVVNLNDGKPPASVLRAIRRSFGAHKERVFLLCSYSPASSGAVMHRDGQKVAMKSKGGYVRQAFAFADALGATHYVPFASQAVFRRSDSSWANEIRVTYDDLIAEWPSGRVELCEPYMTIELDSAATPPRRRYRDSAVGPGPRECLKVAEREATEKEFVLPDDFAERLHTYLEQVSPLRAIYRRGVGWRLNTSGTERFYNTRTRKLEGKIPSDCDIVITVPDLVLYEALQNGVLTDLGITMFTRVDTRVGDRRTRVAFILMGLRDYNHLPGLLQFGKFAGFYAAMMTPGLRRAGTKAAVLPLPA